MNEECAVLCQLNQLEFQEIVNEPLFVGSQDDQRMDSVALVRHRLCRVLDTRWLDKDSAAGTVSCSDISIGATGDRCGSRKCPTSVECEDAERKRATQKAGTVGQANKLKGLTAGK